MAKAARCSLLELFKYADGFDVALMFLGTLGGIVNGLTLPFMVIIRAKIMNDFGRMVMTSQKFSQNALFCVYIAMVAWIASYLEVSCWMRTGERQAAKVRSLHLRSMLRQDVGYFDSEDAGDLARRSSTDMLLYQDAISEKAGSFICNTTRFIGLYLVGFTQTWRLTLIVLPFMPVLVIPGILYGKATTNFELRKSAAYDEAGRIAEQALSSIRTVYSFVAEKRIADAYSRSLSFTVKLGIKQGLAKGLALGSGGLSVCLWSFMAWIGSLLVMRGQANGSEVLTTGLALLTGGRSLGFAISNLNVIAKGRVAACSLFQVIKRVPPIDIDNLEGRQLEVVYGRLQLSDVTFSYPSRPEVAVLNEFSLDVPAGKTVALIGSSGSGKSTVIALLQRFYDPSNGKVMVDGVDIKCLQLRWFREQCSLVSQEPALFATTIKENIMYGKQGVTMDDVIAAAKGSNAHDFITAFPKGYDTQVGERGSQISGGQKQRIALARALIRRPSILLLDEATSALDTGSEVIVQAALERASVDRTTIVVAHKLRTIRNADIIVVLQSGKVVESGRHEELIAAGGAYASLLKLQNEKHPSDKVVLKAEPSETVEAPSKEAGFLPGKLNEGPEEKNAKTSAFWDLLKLCRGDLKQGLLGMTGAVAFGVIQPFCALVFGFMVSVYYLQSHEELKREIRKYSSIFAVLAAAAFVFNLLEHYYFGAVGEHLARNVRERMLQSMLKFEVGWFDREQNRSGSLCSRLSSDAYTVRALVSDQMSFFIQTLSALIACCTIGLFVSWRMGLVMISVQPLLVLCYYTKMAFLQGFSLQAAKAHNEASQVTSEAVLHHRTVTAFSLQDKQQSLLDSKLQNAVRDNRRSSHFAGVGLGLAQFILYSSWGLQFWYGGRLYDQGRASFADVFKIYFVFLSTGRVIGEALSMTHDISKGKTAAESVFRIIHRQSEIDGNNGKTPETIQGTVEFHDVDFCYPARPAVIIFRGLNLTISAGHSLGLVGQSGSGKSSVVGLIERFYDPLRGEVRIDGVNIKEFRLISLRRHIGLVNQEPILFATSLRENIAYGSREGATETEIIEAAKLANAHQFISALPNGYDTSAGESGLQLSGGQKQRIAIARAMLKKPRILLLDEATSALDTEAEQMVQEALNKVMECRTTVVIAHRLSTIQNCDSIAVLQDGAITEQGTHQELLKRNGAYTCLLK